MLLGAIPTGGKLELPLLVLLSLPRGGLMPAPTPELGE
jgi:hypothetical protein